MCIGLLSLMSNIRMLISETYQEKSHTKGLLSIQIDKYEIFTTAPVNKSKYLEEIISLGVAHSEYGFFFQKVTLETH